mgnify:FL=1
MIGMSIVELIKDVYIVIEIFLLINGKILHYFPFVVLAILVFMIFEIIHLGKQNIIFSVILMQPNLCALQHWVLWSMHVHMCQCSVQILKHTKNPKGARIESKAVM